LQPFPAETEAESPPLQTWPDAEAMLDRFRGWLDQTRDESRAATLAVAEPAAAADEFGLVDLAREFTALRHEVKLQTKSARGLDEQMAGALDALAAADSALEEAGRQFHAVAPKEAEAARRAALPLIVMLAELDEALTRGGGAMQAACRRLGGELADAQARQLADSYAALPRWIRWVCRDWHTQLCNLNRAQHEDRMKVVQSLLDGYALVHKRLQRSMAKKHVARIATLGMPVDPRTMTVVEVVEAADAPGHAPGTVIEEIRPGYRWNGRVIRFAEVRAVGEVAHRTSGFPA
jgi:molecular chaperone GrpE